ncbi:MAG: hypothetical protein BMS9Abin20_0860 [Acidimicrobiia bacterium]|nr:MAG: hypothetical protein BMS9Abin20_0860 [Acidimicrobiia bacterium]
MDMTTRWETAAIRTGSRARNQPPRPSGKRPGTTVRWVTLKEAETTTSIPVNTLRKWIRKADLPSYLESDGDIALRMVDLDAVIERAGRLGRTVRPSAGTSEFSSEGGPRASEPGEAGDRATSKPPPEATMIVPIDAWNKMLSQLGNLHEAGQQLAEARERAAKAETEATFLRQRLAEIRADAATEDADTTDVHTSNVDQPETPQPTPAADQQETTTYWRYLTTGWRDRQRRRTRRG